MGISTAATAIAVANSINTSNEIRENQMKEEQIKECNKKYISINCDDVCINSENISENRKDYWHSIYKVKETNTCTNNVRFYDENGWSSIGLLTIFAIIIFSILSLYIICKSINSFFDRI